MKRSRESSDGHERSTRRRIDYSVPYHTLYNKNNEIFNFSNNNETITLLIQSTINFIPSIQQSSEGYHYSYLDSFFKKSLFPRLALNNWTITNNAIYINYTNFSNVCVLANKNKSNAKKAEGLYPVGKNADGYIHYYMIIATSSIRDEGSFIDWFSNRDTIAINSEQQNEDFVRNAITNNHIVVLNGYIKGRSPLDRRDTTKLYSLGANLQPSQALCAFNAVILGAAWGLGKETIAMQARDACNTLLLQRDPYESANLHNAMHNERVVLTFLATSYYNIFGTGPLQPLSEFRSNLSHNSQLQLESDSIVSSLRSVKTDNLGLEIMRSYNGIEYIDYLGILRVVLSNNFKDAFSIWSTDGTVLSDQASEPAAAGATSASNAVTDEYVFPGFGPSILTGDTIQTSQGPDEAFSWVSNNTNNMFQGPENMFTSKQADLDSFEFFGPNLGLGRLNF